MRREVAKTADERLAFLEGMRGLAALYVAIGHICSMADPARLVGIRSQAPIWMQNLILPFSQGHLAVAAFIVISGFCLQLSLFRNGDGRLGPIKRFFSRRARRILPAYYACLAVSVLVSMFVTTHLPGPPFGLYLPVTAQNVAAHVLLVHNFSTDWMYKLNGVLWSIAIEAQLYILFPLLVLSFAGRGRKWTVLGTVGVTLVALAILPDPLKFYPWYLPLFALGMAAAHFAYRPDLRWGHVPRTASFVGIVGLGATALGLGLGATLPITDAAFGVAIAALCYLGTVGAGGRVVKGFATPSLVALGAFSYSLYLMHHPIEQVVYALRPAALADPAATLGYLTLVGLPAMLGISWLFSLAFERPFLRSAAATPPVRSLTPASLPLRVFQPGERKPIVRKRVEVVAPRPEPVAEVKSPAPEPRRLPTPERALERAKPATPQELALAAERLASVNRRSVGPRAS